MPVDSLVADAKGRPGGRTPLLWGLPVAFLIGIWLWLVFSTGGYPARNWVIPMLALGFVGLAAACLLVYPKRPGQLSLAVLTLFGAYSFWVLASNLWAGSNDVSWLATGRTFGYLLALALALTYFTSSAARRAFRYLLMLAVFVLLTVLIWRIWSASHLAALFSANRLSYPVGYADGAAALFLVPFWPLLWLAAGPDERAPVRGIALGLATGLVGLALMTQSRGAAWSTAITLVLLFVICPGRLRLLLYLVVPGLLMVYAFPRLNRYWALGPEATGGGSAARTLTVVVIAAAFIGMILALLEDWVRVSGRMRVIFGSVVLAACLAGLVYGGIIFTRDTGGPVTWFSDAWRQLLAEPVTTGQTMRSGGSGLSETSAPGGEDVSPSREALWKLTWQQLEQEPALGAGADNSGPDFQAAAAVADSGSRPQAPNSLVLQALADTGIIGGVLAFGALLLSLAGVLWPRVVAGWRQARRGWPPGSGGRVVKDHGGVGDRARSRWGEDSMAYGWEMTLLTGTAYWFVHANIQWTWQMAGVTLPALLMLAAGIAAADARAGTMWPQLSKWWERRGLRRAPDPETEEQRTDKSADAATPPKRRFPPGHLEPPGSLSQAFRIALIVLSAAVIILAGSGYLLGLL